MYMKWLIMPLYLILLECNNITKTNGTENCAQDTMDRQIISDDTIINVTNTPFEISQPGYIEKEYFLIINGDTSNFSCFLSLNEKKESISMSYVYAPFQKSYSSFLPEDSASVINIDKIKKYSKHMVNCKEQVREMQLILDFASKEFDLSKLRIFRINMSSVDSLSTNITDLYVRKFGNNVKTIDNKKVSDLISNSMFVNNLNSKLSIYNLKISKVNIDGLACVVKENNFQEKRERLHFQEFSNWIFDGLVVFTLSNVN
jgi:hypothetical protein